MLNAFHKSALASGPQKVLQRRERQANKDRYAGRGEKHPRFSNYYKQMKAPYVIYADFEALVKKMPGCERDPDKKHKSYTEKTEWHEACGFAYIVVRSDGKMTSAKNYRGHKAVKFF